MPVYALRGGQQHRPVQPIAPLSSDQISSCLSTILEPWLRQLGGNAALGLTPVVVTYLTDVPERAWPLGLSASLHGFPLVVVGRGMRWALQAKLPAVGRALQLLNAASPQQPVIFADGTDTVLARSAASSDSLLRHASSSRRRVIFSAECNSWPRCYLHNYSHHSEHMRCRAAGHPTCFPNSGAYLGSSAALLELMPELVRAAAPGFGVRGESGDDQAAVHYAYLQRVATTLSLSIDAQSDVFLNLGACKGTGRPRPFLEGTELCHHGAYEPLRRLTRSPTGSFAVWDGGGAEGGRGAAGASAHRPLLLHANGIHERMVRVWFGRKLSPDAPPTLTTAQSRNLSALWRETLLPSPTKQLAYPVLMVDSAAGGVCNMTTLGRVLETFSPRQSGKPTLHEWN